MKSRELTAPGPEARRGEDIVRREPALLARARRQLDRFPRERRDRRLGPLGLVAIAVGFNLWVLRAEILPVLNLNDSAVHLSTVRWSPRPHAGGSPAVRWLVPVPRQFTPVPERGPSWRMCEPASAPPSARANCRVGFHKAAAFADQPRSIVWINLTGPMMRHNARPTSALGLIGDLCRQGGTTRTVGLSWLRVVSDLDRARRSLCLLWASQSIRNVLEPVRVIEVREDVRAIRNQRQ